ncbi:Mannan endo-1,4-beta-mannosidase 1, partial [Linum grandiflorum]
SIQHKSITSVALLLLILTQCIFIQNTLAAGRTGSCNNSIAKAKGTRFMKNGKSLYLNGFNAYWMILLAGQESTRGQVTLAFREASRVGMNVARTWAFNDGVGGLQISPGVYDEKVFKGLDFVISEAGKFGINVILGLVDNYKDLGGRPQYVAWAKERGQSVSGDDDFYTNPVIRGYYKNHIKTVLTRVNTITSVSYKDDPTIFAWELMNEPRSNDYSGALVQNWVHEMAAYLKSIDSCHMLEVGLEGFYGPSKRNLNPNNWLFGTDFLSNNQLPFIDFATTHLYADFWLQNSTKPQIEAYVNKFLVSHIRDCNRVIRKPLVMAEFGKSFKQPGYSLAVRDAYYSQIYNSIYKSSKRRGSLAGGIFWQLLNPGMDNWGDGYQVVLQNNPSTASIIAQQSKRLSTIHVNS